MFHFHRPVDVDQANEWLIKYLLNHITRTHPETGIQDSRIEVWARGLSGGRHRKVCDPETFWSYISEPELRTVGPDARLILDNKHVYVLDSSLAGEKVEESEDTAQAQTGSMTSGDCDHVPQGVDVSWIVPGSGP